MNLLNEKYKNYKIYGMDYYLVRVTEAIVQLNKWNSKEELVKVLYECYEEGRAEDEESRKAGKFEYMLGNNVLEELLLTAVYVDKKMTWEDIKYTKSHGRLPESIVKKGFPFDEIKEEMFKKGYVPEPETKQEYKEFGM